MILHLCELIFDRKILQLGLTEDHFIENFLFVRTLLQDSSCIYLISYYINSSASTYKIVI